MSDAVHSSAIAVRRPHVNRFVLHILCIACALPIGGCGDTVDPGRPRFTGAGVTFAVPLESSQVEKGPAGIDYRSETIAASTDGRGLRVNGRRYGPLEHGDVVDLTAPGIVKVNGVARSALPGSQ